MQTELLTVVDAAAHPWLCRLASLQVSGRLLWLGVCGLQRVHDQTADIAVAFAPHLARKLAARAAGVAEEHIELRRSNTGKPWVVSASADFGISWSHCAGWVAAAAGSGLRCGIDIETAARAQRLAARPDSLRRLQQRVLASGEAEALAGLPPGDAAKALLQRWVVKEAWAKALGLGLQAPLHRLSVDLGQRPDEAAEWTWTSLPIEAPSLAGCEPWRSWHLAGVPDVHAAVAVAPGRR